MVLFLTAVVITGAYCYYFTKIKKEPLNATDYLVILVGVFTVLAILYNLYLLPG